MCLTNLKKILKHSLLEKKKGEENGFNQKRDNRTSRNY